MKFADLRQKVKNYPFFRSNILFHLTPNVGVLRRQISEWTKHQRLWQLKRGLYTLPDEYRQAKFSRYYLANQLYSPSYISLESALSYYGMIPEQVNSVVSISPKKTQQFNNIFGQFIYRHLNSKLFNDFVIAKDEFENSFFIATPEKAIVDFLYFKSRELKQFDESIFELSFRLQNLSEINNESLIAIAKNFKNKKLMQLINSLIKVKGEL